MPRNTTNGVFTRVSNTFSEPVLGTVIDPSDADATFDDWDTGLSGLAPVGFEAREPSTSDDDQDGFIRGSLWVNTSVSLTTGFFFMSYNNATSAAVWRGLGSYDITKFNVAMGPGCGSQITSGTDNISIGQKAGRTITSGTDNVTIGNSAGLSVNTGLQNTLVGSGAGSAITTDQGHTYIGYNCGLVSNGNTGGSGPWNTGIGHSCMLQMTTGGSNVAMGRAAMKSETTGAFNTGVGHASLFSGAGNIGCVGIGNTAGGGSQAGTDPTVGWNGDTSCIAIGTYAGKATTAARTNLIAIGTNAKCGAKDNHAWIGAGLTATGVSGLMLASGLDKGSEISNAGATLTLTSIVLGYLLRTGAPGGGFSDTTPSAAAILGALCGVGVETFGFYWKCNNQSGQTQTLLGGAGVTISGTATTATGTMGEWLVRFTNTASGTEACTFYRTNA